MDSDLRRGRGADGSGNTLTTLVDVVSGDAGPATGDARLIGRRLEGRYEIRRALDRGGMATVYVALDHRLDREVAVKVMHPSLAHDPAFVARFRREAKAAASIRHRNVVAVTDAGEDSAGGDTVVFLVMELVRGRTLRALLSERGRLAPAQALEITESVLAALDAAHATGLMHRDVKPENVLLGDDGGLSVADFGLARAVEASALTTHAGLLMGTVAYVAPELVSHGRGDARSDVYAAGIVLFEMLTGAVPYEAETPVAVAYRHVHEEVPPPSSRAPGIPPVCDALVRTATARDPEDRYPDAGAFLSALRRARRDPAVRATGGDTQTILAPTAGASATAVLPAVETPARGRRRRWPWVLAIVLALSAAAGVAGWRLGGATRTHVPALSDRSLAGYETALTARHLTWSIGAPAHSDTVRAGEVLGTAPAPGTAVKPHTRVVIQTSSGVLMVTVPTVAGAAQAVATARLTTAGFPAATTTTAYSDTVPTGQVIASDPGAGATVDHRTHVALTVSGGPAPVTIPAEAGQRLTDAQQTLTSLGLHTTVSRAFSDTVPADTVISAAPDSGTGHRGDTVALVVSKGPQLVGVPDLTGQKGDAAAALLTRAGLVPREVALFGIHGGTVVAQSPRGGMVRPGTTVTYYTAY